MLAITDVSLSLGGRVLLRPFTLSIAPGEVVTLLGPSGSGKSSLLALIGGDLDPAFTAAGCVNLNGANLAGVPLHQRRIGRLFQDDLLFPHMTVAENLLFAMPRATPHRVDAMRASLASVGLADVEKAAPHQLSGGQRARVALVRALLASPRALLLDEPFSRLDAALRTAIRQLTFSHVAASAIPALLVTHDRADAPQGGRVLHITADGEVQHV